MPSEFSLIEVFSAAFRPPAAPRGPGDDCAVLPAGRGELCVTTDAVIEGVHFTRKHFSLEDIGHKAIAVNLSDLAAMGADPAWFVCSLELPRGVDLPQVRALARGMSVLARAANIALVGGNVSSGPTLALTLTVAGHVPRGKALLRSKAKAGDLLYVTGTLGDAALGLSILQGKTRLKRQRLRHLAVLRQKRPTPRLALGKVARRFARAAMDVSDGLAQDLTHLCEASGVGASLEVSRLPLSQALRAVPERQSIAWALGGGEDYELLLAIPPARAAAFEAAALQAGQAVSRIGVLRRGRGVGCVDAFGKSLPAPLGFDHFR